MNKVQRASLVDWQTWSDQRPQALEKMLVIKAARRVHLGPHLTFLFENADTVRYQVQEMMRVERIVREADITHELATYNELLGGDGELGCTLLIEIGDPALRDELLVKWLDLPAHLYATNAAGERVPMVFDDRQVGERRLSSVQYTRIPIGADAPITLGCDHPDYTHEIELSDATRAALAADLAS